MSTSASEHVLNRRDFLATGASAIMTTAISAPQHESQAPELRIQRLTWAGVKLELGSRTLLIDAWADTRMWGGAWKEPIVPIDISTPQCSALVTHLHPDHFDPELLKTKLSATGSVICSKEIAATVASRGFRVWPLSLFEPHTWGDFTICAVPAVDGVGASQVAWVVSGGGRRIIHCGDGTWHGDLWRIGRQYGPFDMAFVPINGADLLVQEPLAGVPLSATPEQGAAFAKVLGARLACPIHYGFTDPKLYIEYPDAFPTFRAAAKARGVSVEVVNPGEWVTWRPSIG